MTALRRRMLSTPRLFVVGSFVFAACHRQAPAPAPAPSAPPRQTVPAPTAITNGNALVRAMRDRYPGWYRTLTFVQKTTITTASGGSLVQTWYEAGALPGRLRIDTDLASKSGTLFARDSIYSISSGKIVRADTGLNPLMVLGFDVYAQSPARTEAQLRGLGFDLTKVHEGTWRGKQVYVAGASRGDTVSKQFWVDKETLLFVRMIENSRQGHSDIRFERYAPLGGGWIAERVEQYVNGKPRLVEEYSQIRADVALSDALFDPRQWSTAPHWARPARGRDDDH